ncbi:MAG: TetR/AcrR family transcriptional regulator [Actinomycetota bacterium]|nr:TetR/AcrR family transcriptional regulator [Actinomycetota bacterium]
MVRSAAELLREHGAAATSIDRVLAHSGAPRGSVYHHFPGGRTQLIEEAVALSGDFIAGLIEADEPLAVVDKFFSLWRRWLVDSDFQAGCPIVSVTVAGESPDLAAGVFTRWADGLAASLSGHGVPEARARRLATFVIAAVEGAVVMCRAEKSLAPLEAAAEEIHELLAQTPRK